MADKANHPEESPKPADPEQPHSSSIEADAMEKAQEDAAHERETERGYQ
jgi:hypothetical protein